MNHKPLSWMSVVSLLTIPLIMAAAPVVRGPDVTSPVVISYSPQDRAYNVPISALIYVNFSEPMNPGTVELTTVPSTAFDPPAWSSGMELILSHSAPFMVSTMYMVTLNGMDLAGNVLDGNGDGIGGDPLVWRFSTNCGGICIVDTDPADREVDVPLDHPIVVTFSERVNTTVAAVTVNPPLIFTMLWSNGDTVLTLQHVVPFMACTMYTVMISMPGLVPGPVPNPWRFVTEGCSPMILSIDPPQNGAAITAAIVVNFSKEMDADSVTWALNRTVVLDPTWGFENRTLSLTHAAKFLPCTAYQFNVTGKDKDGRDLVPGPVEMPYNFTTLCTYPRVIQTSPFKGQTNVLLDASISVTFSETMDNESVMDSFSYSDDRMSIFTRTDGIFLWSSDNTTFTFSPDSPFRGQATYTVKINASIAHGMADNFLDGNTNGILDMPRKVDDYTWQFTTAVINDLIPPTVQSVYPEPNTTGVARDVVMSIVFSESMNRQSVQDSIDVSEGTIAYDFLWPNNRTVSFRLIPPLSYDTEYTIWVKTSALDLAGNHIVEQYSWSFTTLLWRGTVYGRLVDEFDGSPISEAIVVLGGVNTITDANGNFTFANVLQNPSIWLNVTKEGYEDSRSRIGVGEGSHNLGDIKLRRIQSRPQSDLGIALILMAVIIAVVFIVLLMLAMRRRRKAQPARFEEWKGEVAEVESDEGEF